MQEDIYSNDLRKIINNYRDHLMTNIINSSYPISSNYYYKYDDQKYKISNLVFIIFYPLNRDIITLPC